jgi:hypothetical protein
MLQVKLDYCWSIVDCGCRRDLWSINSIDTIALVLRISLKAIGMPDGISREGLLVIDGVVGISFVIRDEGGCEETMRRGSSGMQCNKAREDAMTGSTA